MDNKIENNEVINLINSNLPLKYRLNKLSNLTCKIDTKSCEFSDICNWKIDNSKCFVKLLYKDIDTGDISFVTCEIHYCPKIYEIIKSQLVFHLNNLEKIIILDIGDDVGKLSKVKKILELTVPYQQEWYEEYLKQIKDLEHNFINYDKDTDNFFFKDKIHHSRKFFKTNKKELKKNCLTINSIIDDNQNNRKFIIKKPSTFENFVGSNYKNKMSGSNNHSEEKETNDQCDWSHMSACLPKDYNYELPKDYENPKYPVPECCKKFKLDNDNPSLIKKENGNHEYIYVDGRKFLIDKSDIDKCYTASYWLKPELRDNCSTNYAEKIDLSKSKVISVDEACFREIPTECGFNDSKTVPLNESNSKETLRALDCNKAIRPLQKTEATRLIAKEANKWTNRAKKNIMLYNTKSALAGSKYNEIDKIGKNMIGHIQNHNSNEDKIQDVKNAILSKQRQIEISNDETLKINTRIHFLNLLMVFLIIIGIIYLFKAFLTNIFSDLVVLIAIIIVSLIFGAIIIGNLYSMRHRHPDRWELRQWKSGSMPEEKDEFPKSDTQKTIHYPEIEEEDNYVYKTAIPAETQAPKGVRMKCVPIDDDEIQTENTEEWEETLQELNNELNKCNNENKKWVNKRNNLRRKICRAKGLNPKQCRDLFKKNK